MKIFFNCLVYKDLDVVEDMINNIKRFVKNPIIVIHVNEIFDSFNMKRFSNIKDVYINNNRFSHGQYDTKTKALVSNRDYLINNNIDFDYEIIFYPKMLFIKKGIEEYLVGADLCMPTPDQDKRDRMEFALNTKMDVFTEEEKIYFNKGIEKFLVEGLSYSKTLSDKIYDLIKSTSLYERTGHCYEEFIFPTVAKHFASSIKNYPGIISYWELSEEDLKKIINKKITEFTSFFTDNQAVDNIYFIHKVEYGYGNNIRRVIRSIA